jgi:hypothetical protein
MYFWISNGIKGLTGTDYLTITQKNKHNQEDKLPSGYVEQGPQSWTRRNI